MNRFKKYLAVILPTKETGRGVLFYSNNEDKTAFVNYTENVQIKILHTFVHTDTFVTDEHFGEYRHIYIVDGDKIGYNPSLTDSEKLGFYPYLHKKIIHYIDSDYGAKIIVATTDKSLGLPLISGVDALNICNNRIFELYLETEEVGYTHDSEVTFDPIKVAYKGDVVKTYDNIVSLKFTKLYTPTELNTISRKYAVYIESTGLLNNEHTFNEWLQKENL